MDLFGPAAVAARSAEAAAASEKKKRRRGGKRGGKKHGYNSDEEKGSPSPRPAKKPTRAAQEKTATVAAPKNENEGEDEDDGLFKVHPKSDKVVFSGFAARAWEAPNASDFSGSRLSNHEVVTLNNAIAEHAQRKQVAAAVAAFEELCTAGAANSISYAAVVNAHVRCGDLPGAVARVAQAKAAGQKPCVVLYTSLLKGYCGDGGGAFGGLSTAWSVVAELRQRRVQPNVRMVNTLLRGCLLHGDPDRALEVLRGMTNSGKAVGFVDASLAKSAKKNKKKRNDQDDDSRREFVKTAPPGAGSSAAATWGEVANSFVWQPTACDGSSFEYACSLLAQALRGDEAERLVQWASKQAKAPPPKPQAVNAKQTPAALAAAARRGDKGAGAPAAAPKDEGGGGEGGGESGAGSGGAGGLELHAARAHALVGDWHRARPLLLRAHKLGKKHATAAAAAAAAAEIAAEAAAVAEAAAAGWAQAGETDGGETEGGWGEGGGSQTGGARATGGAGGGQRGGRRAEGNAERERSNAVYRAHRHDVLMADVAALKAFVDRFTAAGTSEEELLTEAQKRKRAAAEAEGGGPVIGPVPDLRALFARTLLFPTTPIPAEDTEAEPTDAGGASKKGGAFGKPPWVKATCAAMEQRLSATLGFGRFAAKWDAAHARAAATAAGKSADAAASAASVAAGASEAAARARAAAAVPGASAAASAAAAAGGPWGGASVLDGLGHVRWGAVFPGAAHRPLKLEFGAGTGDWAAFQASHDASLALVKADGTLGGAGGNWCAVELRADRVAATFARVALQLEPTPPPAPSATATAVTAAAAGCPIAAEESVSVRGTGGPLAAARPAGWNLAVAHVGAMALLTRHLRPGSVAAVFVNHPEPPQQRSWGVLDNAAAGDAASEAAHMCDKFFFAAVRAALAPGGRFTVVTDNEWYARLLLATAADLCDNAKLFKSADLTAAGAASDSAAATSSFQGGRGGQGGREGRGKGGRGTVGGRGGRGGARLGLHPGLVARAAQTVKVHAGQGSCHVFVGGPGADLTAAGHAPAEEGQAGSWFDGLWQKDKKTARYVLSLVAI